MGMKKQLLMAGMIGAMMPSTNSMIPPDELIGLLPEAPKRRKRAPRKTDNWKRGQKNEQRGNPRAATPKDAPTKKRRKANKVARKSRRINGH